LPALILIPTVIDGCGNDFWNRYILTNLNHESHSNTNRFLTLAAITSWEPQAPAYFSGLISIILICTIINFTIIKENLILKVAMIFSSILLICITMFCILKTNSPYVHYIYFIVLVFDAIAIVFIKPLETLIKKQKNYLDLRFAACSVTSVISLTPMFMNNACNCFPLKMQWDNTTLNVNDQLVNFLKNNHIPGDRLAIWGWTPSIYVLSNMIPATRDIVTAKTLEESNLDCYYKEEFVEDLRSSKPKYFIDTIKMNYAPVWPIYDKIAPENIAVISNYLYSNYDKIGSYFNNDKQEVATIWKRKEQ
jgi:hypothetical protein